LQIHAKNSHCLRRWFLSSERDRLPLPPHV